MQTCLQCGQNVHTSAGHPAPGECPTCGASLSTESPGTWVDVARVSNLAEAGFLSDELTGLDIEARIHQTDDLSELHGGWKTSYLIRVPAEMANQAAEQIRCHATEATAEAEAGVDGFGFTSEAGPIDPNYWRPVAIIVLAGVASFVLGRQSAMPPAEPPPPGDFLAAAVNSIGQPLVTESIPGKPRHRLTYNRPHKKWYLDTDRDGDGTFDVRREFPTSGATR